MNEEAGYKFEIVLPFKDRTITTIRDMINMAQCIVPLDSADKKVLAEGIAKLNQFKSKLEKADTLREMSELIDIDKLVSEHDIVNEEVSSTLTYANYCRFMERIENAVDSNDEDDDL